MKCPACKALCTDDSNFCHKCGFSLQNSTGRLSAGIMPDPNHPFAESFKRLMPASYIEKLIASHGRHEGERRVVTILFSDVKGSTSLGENLDPEEVLGIMNSAFEVLIKPIMKYEGTIARLMGDAILAFFGAPIAHEDDPERACKAALEIIEGSICFSRKLEKEKGITGFSVRVGINTGLVVVAEVGADMRVEYTAMGDAVNVASRMESSAEPGTILITEETKKLLKDKFKLISVGPIQVKGRNTPVNSYRVISELQLSHLIDYRTHGSPLSGHSKEYNFLLNTVKKSKDYKGKIISVIGECGIGKTRLVSELRKITSDEISWMEVKSVAYQQNNSYWLIKSLLMNDLLKESSTSGESIQQCLLKRIHHKTKNHSYIYSFICYFLGIKPDDYLPFEYDRNDAEALKGQIHYSVKEYLRLCCAGNRLLLLFEDLQWSDCASLELITDIFSLVREHQLIILMTYRKNEGEIWNIHNIHLKEFYKKESEVVLLNALNIDESTELLENLASDLYLSEALKSEILQRTEGNPFFIDETVRALRERHAGKTNIIWNEIPTDEYMTATNMLQGVIMARLDYLLPCEKVILQSASVSGRIFRSRILKALLQESVTEQELENSLIKLVNREFIAAISDAGDNEFMFKHNITQEVAYNSLLISSREKIHLRIANILEVCYPEETPYELLAFHFDKGRSVEKAVDYYLKAADKAKEVFANKQALSFYHRIIKLLEENGTKKELLSKALESCGDIYSHISEYPKAVLNYELCLIQEQNPLSKAAIYQKFGQIFEKWGQYVKAMEYYNHSLELLPENNNILLLAGCYIGMGMVRFREGLPDEGISFTRKALDILSTSSGYELEISRCHNNLGIFYSKYGHSEIAGQHLRRSLEIRKERGNLNGLAASYNNLGYLCQLKGENENAIEYYNCSLDYCEKTGNIYAMAKLYDNLSNIYIALGDNEKAAVYNLKAMDILGKISLKGENLNQHLWLQAGVW